MAGLPRPPGTRRWAVGAGRRQLEAAQEAFDGLHEG